MQGKILKIGLAILAFSLIASAPSRPATSSRNTALIRAAERGQTQEVYRLLQAGADVNAHDADGWTPYLAASSMGQLSTMRVLISFGAKTIPNDLVTDHDAPHRFLADR